MTIDSRTVWRRAIKVFFSERKENWMNCDSTKSLFSQNICVISYLFLHVHNYEGMKISTIYTFKFFCQTLV